MSPSPTALATCSGAPVTSPAAKAPSMLVAMRRSTFTKPSSMARPGSRVSGAMALRRMNTPCTGSRRPATCTHSTVSPPPTACTAPARCSTASLSSAGRLPETKRTLQPMEERKFASPAASGERPHTTTSRPR